MKHSIAFLLAASLGCVTAAKVTNLTPVALQSPPLVNSYDDPQVSRPPSRTFSVFPHTLIDPDDKTNELLEKHLLFALRNRFEEKGYRFVGLDESPDFAATISATSTHSDFEVPAQNLTVPVWVPGTTITTVGTKTNSWGKYEGATTSTTTVPGRVSTTTYTQPGRTVGFETPALGVSVFDPKTLKRVWMGTGAGTSSNPDVRISSQRVLIGVLERFPDSPEKGRTADGGLGMHWRIVTTDGSDYRPAIESLAPGGLAAMAGLQVDDLIWSINGVELRNKGFSEVARVLTEAHGQPIRMRGFRLGRWLDVVLPAEGH